MDQNNAKKKEYSNFPWKIKFVVTREKKSWILFTIDEVLRKSIGCLFKNNFTQT